nr:integrase, catalytic region, zinc finger, CCHC-type, peptidase aspartic, catalytic [Tanacetum cinerariifolium]
MESMISLGQKNTLVEYMILFGTENHPPMLDNDLRESVNCMMHLISLLTSWGSLHQYYLRFTQLINNMNIYNMKLEQFQVNTKFLNNLPPKWSKILTDVKLVKDLHTTNFDQLHSYLEQHELHANKTEDLDTYNSDCDDISNAKVFLMANIPNYGSNIISEVPHSETYLNDMENQSVLAIQDFEQPSVVDFTDNEIHSDSNIILYSQYFQETQQENVQDNHLQAQQDSTILYVIEQILTEYFGKRFTPQQELLAEQAFWLRMSNPTSKPSDALPVKIKAPKELPKISLVKESLKKLKFYLVKFDNVVKIRTTPNARTEGKEIVDIAAQKPSANTIVPGTFKLGLKYSTSNCGSNPSSNKKKDRISQTPSRNMKNKVEAQPRN